MSDMRTSERRELTPEEQALIQAIRIAEATVAAVYHRTRRHHIAVLQRIGGIRGSDALFQVSIARSEMEGAFMRLIRSIAHPETPWINPDETILPPE